MAELLEGELSVRRHGDGRIEILAAPQTCRISLEMLADSDPVVFKVGGRRITIADQVAYEVTGWDPIASALVAEKVGA